jgi:hypothetical protein
MGRTLDPYGCPDDRDGRNRRTAKIYLESVELSYVNIVNNTYTPSVT